VAASVARALVSSVGLALHRIGRAAAGGGPSLRILYYHSVSDAPIRAAVAPAAFERQMQYLSRSPYRLLALGDAVRQLLAQGTLPPDSLAVTLDDGFADNYEQAFPLLSRYRIPATIFLTVGYIGTGRLPTLSRTEHVPRPLDWAQVREMHAHGVEFGSHTMTHPMLSEVSLDEARRELVDSRRVLEDRLGAPAGLFCYPRGDFSEPVKQAVREAGYVAACSTLPGLNGRHPDLFALRRTYVSRRDTIEEFAKRTAGAYDLLQRGLTAWRRGRGAAGRGPSPYSS
jgi:peptidoglycan/xylan/chitin deacetylase (PgdA/CDA1 family)